MSNDTSYKPEIVPLHWPIDDDKGSKITSVTLNLIYHKDHADIIKKDLRENPAFREFLQLSSGLSASEVKRLAAPDWNGLKLKLSDIITKGSGLFFERAGIEVDHDSPRLLQPIASDSGKKITRIDIQVPTVDTIEVMESYEQAEDRTLFINMKCTGLSEEDLDKMSMPDWNTTQRRLNDFLNETADYFQSGTSKPSQTSSP